MAIQVSDYDVEQILGRLLRAGVVLSATVVGIGAALYLTRHHGAAVHYRTFTGEPSDLRSLPGIFEGAVHGQGRNIIQAGVILLIATPVARVFFSAVAFVLERDWLYVLLTLLVLGLLLFSLFQA